MAGLRTGVPAPLLIGGSALLLLGASALPAALATPRYRVQAIRQVHYDQGNPLWQLDRRVMACTFCHTRDSGGEGWNSFGRALQAQFRAEAEAGNAGTFAQVLSALLRAQQDADQDGYSDALEVFAQTLPGDPGSTPTQALATLLAEFEAAGGAAQYAPPSPRP